MLAGVPLYQKFWTTQSSLMRAQRNKLVCPLLSPYSPMQIATLSFDEFSACLLALSFRVETL
jgi:hypothetical protein